MNYYRVGDVVVFRGQTKEQRNWGGNDDANTKLVVGQEYIVSKVETHSYHTKLHFENVEGRFNSVCFGIVGAI